MELLRRAPEIEIANQGDLGRSLGSDKCETALHFVWRPCGEDDCGDWEVLARCRVQLHPSGGDGEFGTWERQGREGGGTTGNLGT